jgi:hypothetical protein
MSNEMNNLFVTEGNATTVGNRGLSGTAQLTNLANSIATDIIKVLNTNIAANNGESQEWIEALKKSQADNSAMDNLIEKVYQLSTYDDVEPQVDDKGNPIEVERPLDFLRELDEDTIDGMLKSQQSKRSRCKSKAMTVDNYKALMSGAIAENLIRLATGKEKHAGGARRLAGSVDYTIEQLQALSEDQEKLKKEIRNVQSKKSIMKSKADFDESDERYQALLKAEQQLKDMRVNGSSVVEVDTTKNELASLLEGKDLEHMKAADAKELLAQIQMLTSNKATDEDDTVEEATEN